MITHPIKSFKSGDYTVTRRAAGTLTAGRYTQGAATSFAISASVQPAGGRELQALPEAESGKEIRVLFTTTELRTRGTSDADTVSIGGETWTVIRVETWPEHYRCYLARQDTP